MAQYYQISFDQLKQLFPDLSSMTGEENLHYTIVSHGQELTLNNQQLNNLQVQDEVRQGASANDCISVVKAESLNGQYCFSVKDVNQGPNNIYMLEGLGTTSNSASGNQPSDGRQTSHQQVSSTNSLPSKQLQTLYITTAPSQPVVPVTYVSVPSEEVNELSESTGVVGNASQKTGCVSLIPEEVANATSMGKLLTVNKENHVSLESKDQLELEEVSQGSVLSSSQVRVIQNSVNQMASQAETKIPSTQLITLAVPQQSVTVSPSSVVQQIQSNCQLSTTQVSLPNGRKISLQEYRQMQPQSQATVMQAVKAIGRGESPVQLNKSTPKLGKRTPKRGGASPRAMKRSTINNVSPGRMIVLDQRRDVMEQNLLLVRNDSLHGSINQDQEPPQLIRQGSNSDLRLNHFGPVDEQRQVVMLVPSGTMGEHQMLTVTVPSNDAKPGVSVISTSDSPRQVSRVTSNTRLVTASGNILTSPRSVSSEGTVETSSGSFVGTPVLTKHNIEERKLVPGKVAHCQYCGYHSEDFNRCDRCRRKVPVNCKEMPITHSKIIKEGISCQKFYKGIREGGMTDSNIAKAERSTRSRKPRKFEEPVILTISSDEDEETDLKNDGNVKESSVNNYDCENGGMMSYTMEHMLPPLSSLSAFEKEPIIKDNACNEIIPEEERNVAQAIEEGLQESQNGATEDECNDKERAVFLTCRTVRIGSYKAIPKDRVVICKQGIRIRVPDIEDSSKVVSITFTLKDVVKALIHFGRAMPVIFLYTSYQCGIKIRNSLKMTSRSGLFYDPCALDETQKRITLLPERMTEDTKARLKSIFCGKDLLVELDSKEANDILVRASPKEVQETIKKSVTSSPTMSLKTIKDYTQKILIYPPPPAKGGITINPEDYLCLGEDQFLNDVIIDFYLKYLTQSCLSEVDQSRTHVFSSFFYKRLTTRPIRSARRHHPLEMDGSTSPAEKRHARVKSWTKNVNIFEKDFIVIPINESAHWFLAIICFPGLEGCVRMSDGVPVKLPPAQPRPSKKIVKKPELEKEELIPQTCIVKPIQIGNTTITPITTPAISGPAGSGALGLPVATINLEERDGGLGGDDFSDRDEAEGEEEDIQMPSESEDEGAAEGGGESQPRESEEGMDGSGGDEASSGEGNIEGNEEKEEENASEEAPEAEAGDGEKGLKVKEEGEEDVEPKEEECSQGKNDQMSSSPIKTEADENSKPSVAQAADDKEAEDSNIEYCSQSEPIKQPCILIFDSLAGSSRSRVVATLRDYLRIEYKVKKGTEREFSKDTIKGACPRVPQQTNFVDCGLYVLQYVESFFENPVKDYRIPIRSLTQWFPEEVVNRKREAIHELIIQLMKEQNITLKLPKIILPSPLSRTNFLPDEEEGTKVLATGDIGEILKTAQEQGQLVVKADQSGIRGPSGMRYVSVRKVGDQVKVVLETIGTISGGEPIRMEHVFSEMTEDRVAGGVLERVLDRSGGELMERVKEECEAKDLMPSKEAEGLEEGELEDGADDEEMEVDDEDKEAEEEVKRKQANPVVRSYQALASKRKSIHQEESGDGSRSKEKCELESAGKKLKS
ncbi:sentrin-specific protease 6-like isoform X2 [Hetaerina americana]|uniref:sentrin-specific protease 6-like isoform X2 n=1 Tax=Hetaerina americana TaxID=62018 RepID=UPI003A7F609E